MSRHEPDHHHRPSPLDGRYAAALLPLRPIMSEHGYMHRRVQVEVAWFIALSDAGFAEFKPSSTEQRLLAEPGEELLRADSAAIKKSKNHQPRRQGGEYWIKSKFKAPPD
jgi:adenylosuccinate lyase